MTVLTEGRHPGEAIMSELPGKQSRENATILESQTIVAGQLLGALADTGVVTAAAAANAGNTGNGVLTLATPPVTSAALEGVYKVTFIEPATDLGTFEVEGPDGSIVGTGKVGTAFAKQVKFTIADGATDFVAGDGFKITVGTPAGSFAYKAWDPDAADGTEVAAAMAIYPATTGVGETAEIAVIARGAELNVNCIAWPDGTTDAEKAAVKDDLEKRGILLR